MKSDMENNEWADEEMSLKQVNKNNPFAVPVGYFDEAGQRILSLIKLEEFKTSNPAQGFVIPENYFESLEETITDRILFENIGNVKETGFTVPADYFDGLTTDIKSRVRIEAFSGSEARPFSVPDGYFENLQQQITARVAVEELLETDTATTAFTVPDGYFEKLNKSILNKTVNQDMVVRKTIVRKLWASNTFKYATAACLALVIGAGVFLREASAPVTHKQTYLHTQLSEVPVDEIKDYLELRNDGSDPLIGTDKQINIEDLDANLQDYIDVN
ncbi:hypothetical protein [Mucilaginibacter sp.]|uniref:hypothetical protein n=1 Tax=Mucilaginibacter sp. TaxID=1882438 RepID=UPI0035BC82E5